MHSWYDWLKDIVVPGVAGGGSLIVGAAALVIAWRSHLLTRRVMGREQDRSDRAERSRFGERVRSYAEEQRASRVSGVVLPPASNSEQWLNLNSAAATLGQPHAQLLCQKVATAMEGPWSSGNMLLAMTNVNSLVDLWVRDPAALLDL